MVGLSSLVIAVAVTSASGDLQLIQFTQANSPACAQVAPVVAQLQKAGYPIRQVDVDRNRSLADRLGVASVPSFVLFSGGRELARHEGPLTAEQIQAMFRQASSTRPKLDRSILAPTDLHAAQPATPPSLANSPPAGSAVATSAGQSSDGLSAEHRALAASVRLRVEDAAGFSFGTGTVIDVHGDEALVVTCGHIFRDSQGQGRITVDTAQASDLAGRLISYDLTRDVALVSFRSTWPIPAVPVPGPGHVVQVGEGVFSVGCNKGANPTIEYGRVTAINKYLGPDNLTVSGQPVDGRSGGGLFDGQGRLIGVCNAADPQDREGLYAALRSIHAELDRTNLAYIYQRDTQGTDSAAPASRLAGGPATGRQPATLAQAAAAPTAQPMAAGPSRPAGVRPAVAGSSATADAMATAGAASQPAADSNLDLEVVCVIRSRSQPDAKSQVVILDSPSRGLLDQIRQESRGQAGRLPQPTGWRAGR